MNFHGQAGTETFTNEQLALITRPCVYRFMRGGKILYIGSSVEGLLRVASRTHHRIAVRHVADEIRVQWFKKDWQAQAAERQLIKKHKPPFNGKADPRLRRIGALDAFVERMKVLPA